jgi:hypothetical protein
VFALLIVVRKVALGRDQPHLGRIGASQAGDIGDFAYLAAQVRRIGNSGNAYRPLESTGGYAQPRRRLYTANPPTARHERISGGLAEERVGGDGSLVA